jgi:carbonic anhydrase
MVIGCVDSRVSPEVIFNADYLHRLEFAAVELSLKNLMTYPFIRDLVERGKLHLHGAYVGIAAGHLLVLDPESGCFVSLAENSGGLTSTADAAAAGSNSALLAMGQRT